MGYADKFDSMDSGRDICPQGTYAFVVTKTQARDKDGNIQLVRGGDSQGIPEVSILCAPLKDPQNVKSAAKDLGLFHRVAVPFETEGARILDQQTYLKVLSRLCNVVGERLPKFSWKDKGAQKEVMAEADVLATELFSEGGDLDGSTFIAEVVHTKSEKDGKVYANLRGISQELGDRTLSTLE